MHVHAWDTPPYYMAAQCWESFALNSATNTDRWIPSLVTYLYIEPIITRIGYLVYEFPQNLVDRKGK